MSSDARYILPANVSIGDTIRVTYPPYHGIVKSVVGTVARRDYRGHERVLTTAEGGEILVWMPGRAAPKVTLLERGLLDVIPELAGFSELLDTTKERIK